MKLSAMQFSKNNFLLKNNFGGDERARTADPLRARQVLSQLSYTPIIQEARVQRQEARNTTSSCFRLLPS
jgi:hypothetical protein